MSKASIRYAEPLWRVWLSTFLSILVKGNNYYGIRRGNVRMAWFVAGVIAGTCGKIRRGE